MLSPNKGQSYLALGGIAANMLFMKGKSYGVGDGAAGCQEHPATWLQNITFILTRGLRRARIQNQLQKDKIDVQ